MSLTPEDLRAWVRRHPPLPRIGIRISVVAVILGLYALAGIITGDGVVSGLQIGLATALAWGVLWAFTTYRAHTAPPRAAKRERTRAAHEAAHRGDDGQAIT